MIRSVVFDMGGVLTDFDPKAILSAYTQDPETIETLRKGLFASPQWQMLDAGEIHYPDAVAIWQQRFPELQSIIAAFAEGWFWHKRLILPTNRLAKALKTAGLGVYLLSNTTETFPHYQQSIPAFRYIDGMILSYQQKALKPEPQLYQILLDTYRLKAEECFFIDDTLDNVAAARALGFHSEVFPKQDVTLGTQAIESALAGLGVSIPEVTLTDAELSLWPGETLGR